MELTREKVLAMDMGREMDALVAERVMGAKGIMNVGTAWFVNDNINDLLPRYSTNISAAWDVIEAPHIMDKVQLGLMPTSFGMWMCRSYMPGWNIQVQSITAADAISRAALLTTIKE